MTAAPPAVFLPTYEFTDKQNALIRALAWRMRFVGGGLLTTAAICVGVSIFGKVELSSLVIVAGVLLGCIGFWSVRAAGELMAIVELKGTDVPHLMRALMEIRKLYEVQLWVIGAMLVLVLLSVAARVAA